MLLCVKQLLNKLLRLFPYEQPWYMRYYHKSCLPVFQVEYRSFLNSLERMAFFVCVFLQIIWDKSCYLHLQVIIALMHINLCSSLDHIRATFSHANCFALEITKLVRESITSGEIFKCVPKGQAHKFAHAINVPIGWILMTLITCL